MLPEGALNPNNCVLSNRKTSEASVSGEALVALPLEGVLNPINCKILKRDVKKQYLEGKNKGA